MERNEMAEIEVIEKRKVQVRWLEARCSVRYWEDATVNGLADVDGSRKDALTLEKHDA